MKYFHNIIKPTLGYKKCQQPVSNKWSRNTSGTVCLFLFTIAAL